jgi:glycosyltransferase involved in cell wall biosynthesis
MLATLQGVRRAGFSVRVVAPPEGPLPSEIRRRGTRILPVSFCDSSGDRLPQAELRDNLDHLLTAHRPDLVHANSLAMARLAGPVAARLGIPSVGHLRDIVRLSAQAVADVNCNTRLLAVSEATRRYHVAAGLDRDKTFVLYNGVDLDEFQPRPATGYLHAELHLPPRVPLIATVGQISLRKGLDVVAKAAVLLSTKHPTANYLVVGQRWSEKPETRKLESDLRDTAVTALSDRMHFLGFRDDVPRLLNELTLLVHAAREEPLGRVLLEAAASGVPVVAAHVGGTPEIFPPGSRSARLVPPDDAHSLAFAVEELLCDARQRAAIAAAARRQSEQFFDARKSAVALVRHYRDVLGAKTA